MTSAQYAKINEAACSQQVERSVTEAGATDRFQQEQRCAVCPATEDPQLLISRRAGAVQANPSPPRPPAVGQARLAPPPPRLVSVPCPVRDSDFLSRPCLGSFRVTAGTPVVRLEAFSLSESCPANMTPRRPTPTQASRRAGPGPEQLELEGTARSTVLNVVVRAAAGPNLKLESRFKLDCLSLVSRLACPEIWVLPTFWTAHLSSLSRRKPTGSRNSRRAICFRHFRLLQDIQVRRNENIRLFRVDDAVARTRNLTQYFHQPFDAGC